MKNVFFTAVAACSLFIGGCKNSKDAPNVSHIQVNTKFIRYDSSFFGIDTNQVETELDRLFDNNPAFTRDYLYQVLALPPQPDSVPTQVRKFIRTYQSVFEDAQKLYGKFEPLQKELTKSLQYAKYYFPEQQLPEDITLFVGPINSFANVVTETGLGVGLQLYLGATHPLYLTEEGQMLYPQFISRKFTQEYLLINTLQSLLEDWFPPLPPGKSLVAQMIEIGKRKYVLSKLFPGMADSLILGYTDNQMKGCLKSEAFIWAFFAQNNLLFETQPALIQEFVSDGPHTAAISLEAPGNIGAFTGLAIVRKWMDKNKNSSLTELMKKDPLQLFEEAKYKP